MLSNLTNSLIKRENEDYENSLLIEGIMLGANISTPKRYSFTDLSECDNADLEAFKNKISSVTFTDNMSVDDKKQALLRAVKTPTVINESSEDGKNSIDDKLKDYRIKYIEACRNKDNNLKRELISQIKDLEKLKNK